MSIITNQAHQRNRNQNFILDTISTLLFPSRKLSSSKISTQTGEPFLDRLRQRLQSLNLQAEVVLSTLVCTHVGQWHHLEVVQLGRIVGPAVTNTQRDRLAVCGDEVGLEEVGDGVDVPD